MEKKEPSTRKTEQTHSAPVHWEKAGLVQWGCLKSRGVGTSRGGSVDVRKGRKGTTPLKKNQRSITDPHLPPGRQGLPYVKRKVHVYCEGGQTQKMVGASA